MLPSNTTNFEMQAKVKFPCLSQALSFENEWRVIFALLKCVRRVIHMPKKKLLVQGSQNPLARSPRRVQMTSELVQSQ